MAFANCITLPTHSNHSTMSSREIAELTGKQHSNVMRDIRAMECSEEFARLNFHPSSYVSKQNKSMPMVEMTRDGYDLLIAKYTGLARVPTSMKEKAALSAIEQVLEITLLRQYCVGGYRIDGYDAKNNVAYEIDETHHKHTKQKDELRQMAIRKILHCKFIRISV